MLRSVAIVALVLIGACSEIDGPSLVRHEGGYFYIRHVPILDGTERIEAMANEVCARSNATPKLRYAQQYYRFDVRYAAYRCR